MSLIIKPLHLRFPERGGLKLPFARCWKRAIFPVWILRRELAARGLGGVRCIW